MQLEILLHWLAIFFYAISGVLFAYGLIFRKGSAVNIAFYLAIAGFLFNSAALGVRWLNAGRGPFMRRYEIFSSNVWMGLAFYFYATWRKPSLKPVGAFLMPVAFLMIGLALMASPEIRNLPPTFRNPWLSVHIAFAKLAFGGGLVGSGLAVPILLKKRQSALLKRLPEPVVLDQLSYQFIAFGFVSWTIMIISGAIWAESAWGRYWAWDPVETWSLITWAVYGAYLHLRRMHGWSGERAAWLAIFALLLLSFTLFWLGVAFPGNHSPYTI